MEAHPQEVLTDVDWRLSQALVSVPGIVGVLLGGSRAAGVADDASDTDLYALYRSPAPAAEVRHRALSPEADAGRIVEETAWGVEDHFHVAGRFTEVVYLDLFEVGVERFYDPGVAPNGYTTAFLATLAHGIPLDDPNGEVAALRKRLTTYPEATRRLALAQLPRELVGYLKQLRQATTRGDWAGMVNRRAAFQAAWFELAFALDRRYHPGEKRLLHHLATLSAGDADTIAAWEWVSLARADDPALIDRLQVLADVLTARIGLG